VHESYARGEQTLSKIRTNILFGSIYLRDALFDGSRRESYRVELVRLRMEADGLLGSSVPEVTSEQEREHWTRLQRSSRILMLDDYVKRRSGEPGAVDHYETLSDREREVFQLIAEGKTNKDIASLLFISPSTVETHRAHPWRNSTYTARPRSSCTQSGAASSDEWRSRRGYLIEPANR